MSEHIKPCIICGCHDMYYVIGFYNENLPELHSILCNQCKTYFRNELYEESKEETIEWFNNLPRKEQ